MEENKSSVKNKTCPNCKKDFLCLSDDIGSCECNLVPFIPMTYSKSAAISMGVCVKAV